MRILRCLDAQGVETHAAPVASGYERLVGSWEEGWRGTGAAVAPARWLPPVDPTAILCIGLNYRRHAEETGARLPEFPVIFMKNPAAAIGHLEPIEIPSRLPSSQVDYECELAVVIGRTCRNASAAEAMNYVMGFTCANDVSARDWQKRGGGHQWCRGKSFDTFCPLGPWLVTPDEVPDPQALRLRTRVNGQLRQDSSTSDMIFSISEILEFLSASTTLRPGTVILTGTPEGVGMAMSPPQWLSPGDLVSIEIDGLGRLENPVGRENCDAPLPGIAI